MQIRHPSALSITESILIGAWSEWVIWVCRQATVCPKQNCVAMCMKLIDTFGSIIGKNKLCVTLCVTPCFGRGEVSCSLCVLIRALWWCEYVYKMLTTVSIFDLVTSQSSKYTVPISFFKLHVESGPDSRTWSGAQPKADCQSKLPFIFHSLGLCPLYFHMLYCFFCFLLKRVLFVI